MYTYYISQTCNEMHMCIYTLAVSLRPIHIVNWEPEGHYHHSRMFHWEPEGRYHHRLCTAIAAFWLSTEQQPWRLIAPFWLSTDDILGKTWKDHTFSFMRMTLTRHIGFFDQIKLKPKYSFGKWWKIKNFSNGYCS